MRVGRAELEHPEQQLADFFVARGLLREVAHDQGDKKASAKAGGLFLADRVQARGVVELFAQAQVALEGQLRVHRYHRRVAIAFDHTEHFIGVFGGRAWCVVIDVKAFHAPDLQHGWRRNDAVIAAVGSCHRVGVERVFKADDFAPLANHWRVDLVPGVYTAVLAPNQGAHFG